MRHWCSYLLGTLEAEAETWPCLRHIKTPNVCKSLRTPHVLLQNTSTIYCQTSDAATIWGSLRRGSNSKGIQAYSLLFLTSVRISNALKEVEDRSHTLRNDKFGTRESRTKAVYRRQPLGSLSAQRRNSGGDLEDTKSNILKRLLCIQNIALGNNALQHSCVKKKLLILIFRSNFTAERRVFR
jgi:hypothetical protein